MWDLFDFNSDDKTSLFEKVVGIELLDRVAGFHGVAGLADDVDIGIGVEHGRDQAAHGRRIVDDEDTRWCHYAPLLYLPV